MNNESIPLVDLQGQYRSIRTEILDTIATVLDGMRLTLGPNVSAFEEEFAAYCGARFCIGVGSGTEALFLVLLAADVGSGDEVIVPAHTFIATAEAVSLTGATPVVVDVESDSRGLDAALLEAAITGRTRAIIPVHMHGQMADLDAIKAIAEPRGIPVIEDAAQAHGAELNGRRAGSIGDAACFSFYCSKNLGAYGEAGAITTNDPDLAESLRLWRNHGESGRYKHVMLGTNSRLDELQAAILRVKLRYLDRWNDARRAHAVRLTELLQGAGVELPVEASGRKHVYHHYAVLAEDRDGLRQTLADSGVMTGVHYPEPVHLQPAYESLGYGAGDLPVAEGIAARVLSLPMYAELRADQVERIATSVREAIATRTTGIHPSIRGPSPSTSPLSP